MNYTDAEIMDSIVGSKTMTGAACDVIRAAIALSKSPFSAELHAKVMGNAMALDCFLPKPLTVESELAKVDAAFSDQRSAA